jgi:hypothetical protein
MKENSTASGKAGKHERIEQVQSRKEELIAKLISTRGMILTACRALPAKKHDQVFLGIWSIKDVLAHLIGWDIANRQAVGSVRNGELPAIYAFIDRDWKSYNARLVAEHKIGSLLELVSTAQTTHRQLLETLQATPAEEFDRDTGVRYKGYKVTISRLLNAELQDEKVHYAQIEEFRGV